MCIDTWQEKNIYYIKIKKSFNVFIMMYLINIINTFTFYVHEPVQ